MRIQNYKIRQLDAQPDQSKAYRCLCCRDTGFVHKDHFYDWSDRPAYLTYQHEWLDAFDELPGVSEAFRCQNPSCDGMSIWVNIPNPDGSSTPKLVDRCREDAILETITAEQCQHIHRAEWDRMRQKLRDASDDRPFDLAAATAAIVKPMPTPKPYTPDPAQRQESPQTAEIDPLGLGNPGLGRMISEGSKQTPSRGDKGQVLPAVPESVNGMSVGDVVLVTIAHFTKQEQKDIRDAGLECEGLIVSIESFELIEYLYRLKGWERFMASVRTADGKLFCVGVDYLKAAEVDV